MKCAYCQKDIEKGKGLMYVRKIGTIRYFCSRRCYQFDVVQRKKPKAKEIQEMQKKAKNAQPKQ